MTINHYMEKGVYCAWYEVYNGNSYWVFLGYGTLESKFQVNSKEEAIKMVDDYMKKYENE